MAKLWQLDELKGTLPPALLETNAYLICVQAFAQT